MTKIREGEHDYAKKMGANGIVAFRTRFPRSALLVTIRHEQWYSSQIMRVTFLRYLSCISKLRENDPLLFLILATAIGIADLAYLIGLEEQNLAEPLVGIDL